MKNKLNFIIITLVFSTQLISSESGATAHEIPTQHTVASHIADPETTARVASSTQAIPYKEIADKYNAAIEAFYNYVKSGGKGEFPDSTLSEFEASYGPYKVRILNQHRFYDPKYRENLDYDKVSAAIDQAEIISALRGIYWDHVTNRSPRAIDGLLDYLQYKFKSLKYKLANKFNTFTKRYFNSKQMDELKDIVNTLNEHSLNTKQGGTFYKEDIDDLLNRQNRIETRSKVLQKIRDSAPKNITDQIAAAVNEGILKETDPRFGAKQYTVIGTKNAVVSYKPTTKAELEFRDAENNTQRKPLEDINDISQHIINENLDVLGDH